MPLPFSGAASGLRVSKLSVSSSGHCLLLTEQGRVFAWGTNQYGQLGTGDISQPYEEPRELYTFRDEELDPPSELIAMHNHSFAVRRCL